MAETLFMRKTLGGLRPSTRASQEAFDSIPLNEDLKVEISRPRNLRHHKKFYALLQVIYPNQHVYATMDSFVAAIKCALGYGEMTTLPDGRIVLVPGSISFARMDQSSFEDFYNRALDLIQTRILPGIAREDVNREVDEILAGREAA